jgi:hypothetical protein
MGLISNTHLQATLDKLARWAATAVGDDGLDDEFSAGFTAANAAVMSGAGSLFTYYAETVAAINGDAAADLLGPARNLDEDNPVPPTRFLIQITGISAFFTALNSHIRRYNPATTTVDAYLTSLNGATGSTPTLRVHPALHNHLRAFSRQNIFVGADTVLATLTVTGAATGTFASVTTLAGYAGAKLVVKNQGAVTTGATLTVTGKKLDGTTAQITATIATGTDNAEADLSVTTQLFTEVTAISISSGTNTDVYEIVAKTDRDITAA